MINSGIFHRWDSSFQTASSLILSMLLKKVKEGHYYENSNGFIFHNCPGHSANPMRSRKTRIFVKELWMQDKLNHAELRTSATNYSRSGRWPPLRSLANNPNIQPTTSIHFNKFPPEKNISWFRFSYLLQENAKFFPNWSEFWSFGKNLSTLSDLGLLGNLENVLWMIVLNMICDVKKGLE